MARDRSDTPTSASLARRDVSIAPRGHEAKAPEDWRSPRPGGVSSGPGSREASWTAVVLYRFPLPKFAAGEFKDLIHLTIVDFFKDLVAKERKRSDARSHDAAALGPHASQQGTALPMFAKHSMTSPFICVRVENMLEL